MRGWRSRLASTPAPCCICDRAARRHTCRTKTDQGNSRDRGQLKAQPLVVRGTPHTSHPGWIVAIETTRPSRCDGYTGEPASRRWFSSLADRFPCSVPSDSRPGRLCSDYWHAERQHCGERKPLVAWPFYTSNNQGVPYDIQTNRQTLDQVDRGSAGSTGGDHGCVTAGTPVRCVLCKRGSS